MDQEPHLRWNISIPQTRVSAEKFKHRRVIYSPIKRARWPGIFFTFSDRNQGEGVDANELTTKMACSRVIEKYPWSRVVCRRVSARRDKALTPYGALTLLARSDDEKTK